MDFEDKYDLILDPRTSGDILRELAEIGDREILPHLAEHHNTPEDVLRHLAKDVNVYIRAGVARNTSTPDDVLRDLIKDWDDLVRKDVAENTSSSIKTIITLFEYEKSPKNPSARVILALYQNKNLPYVAKVIIETLFREML